MEANELEMVSFTGNDRCDQCRSQALAIARFAGRADLLFCWHHKEKYGDSLLDQGWTIIEDCQTYDSYKSNQYVTVD